jgi:hypothetical protein
MKKKVDIDTPLGSADVRCHADPNRRRPPLGIPSLRSFLARNYLRLIRKPKLGRFSGYYLRTTVAEKVTSTSDVQQFPGYANLGFTDQTLFNRSTLIRRFPSLEEVRNAPVPRLCCSVAFQIHTNDDGNRLNYYPSLSFSFCFSNLDPMLLE